MNQFGWVDHLIFDECTISPWLSEPSHLDWVDNLTLTWVDHLTLTEWTISPCLSGPYHLVYICPSHIDWVGQYHLGWVHHFTLTEWTVLPWLSGPSSSESLGPRHPSLPLCKTLNNIFIRPSLQVRIYFLYWNMSHSHLLTSIIWTIKLRYVIK